ncbi:MAG: hypothetical protein NTX86_01680 [Candidatus Dependentiae bacterium]|nr:hypothetical protein [Candidatus Dependentiae bacterium]
MTKKPTYSNKKSDLLLATIAFFVVGGLCFKGATTLYGQDTVLKTEQTLHVTNNN